jgi:hypothetical protein
VPPDYRPIIALFFFLLVCGVLLVGSCPQARAEPLAPVPKVQLEQGKLLVVDGRRGQWWPLETAFVLAREHQEVQELAALFEKSEETVDLLNERIAEKDARIANFEEVVKMTEERAAHAEKAISFAEQEAAREKARAEKAHAWYRHPLLWLSLGVIAGGSAAIAAMR